MIRYSFTADPDLFTVTIETGEIDPVRALRKVITVMGLECQKAVNEEYQSEFEKWLSSTTGENAMKYISDKYMINNPQSTSPLNPLPNGGYSVNMVNGTFTITKRDESVCLCVSICIIMRDEILPRLRSMLGNR